ncbi:MAG: hypothetical protein A2W91_09600 [Bacteroidetes bacterium GWF2_38_335]|nr:MAG: hypothetical protein A2W91_09600 [Bacteroidetes bacterium GWF2_38_335]OFY78845.1 MAG: hypothetical protein A2281_13935 [Bacteroidetes bacterium RIFOXYA12_FULL_38_20]HBS86312.1 redox-sensing transcriptional repressor Rex [Bacteroidales bacterium]
MEKAAVTTLPDNTIERFFKYRRLLLKYLYLEQPHIFSHDLARVLNISPVLVRRDLMLIGCHGNNRKGYPVNELIEVINSRLSAESKKNAVLIGIDGLGAAATEYFLSEESSLSIVATFDYIPKKENNAFTDIPCYGIMQLGEIIKTHDVSIAVLAVSTEDIESVVRILIDSGIKGILNFTPYKLDLPKDIYLEEFDPVSKLEKVSYFVR